MHLAQHPLGAAQRGGDHRRPVAAHQLQLGIETVVAGMHDQVEHPRRHGLAGSSGAVQFVADLPQPLVELLDGTGVGRRHAADDAGAAAGGEQLWAGNQEHRCGQYRNPQVTEQVEDMLLLRV
ncbi:hypothetical protein D3C75_1016610 [compost metagenome]